MVEFTWLDWFWVAAFLLAMLFSGALFYRLGRRSESDFFLADRKLPWWLPATSVYATHTATDTPMWMSGVVYRYGLPGLWYGFFSAWCAVSAYVSTRIFRRSLAYSQAEWQTLRYSGLGSELLRGWIAGWQIFMNMMCLGWVGMAMGKVCSYAFGWPSWVGLVVFSSLCAVYVLAAGYWGVVIADFQQGVVVFVGIVIISVWGVAEAGWGAGIVEKLGQMGELDRLNPFHFTGWFSGEFPLAWFLTSPATRSGRRPSSPSSCSTRASRRPPTTRWPGSAWGSSCCRRAWWGPSSRSSWPSTSRRWRRC
jgi:Na+/proline symporter